MIGERVDGWKWAQASGLSLGLHAALLGYLVYQPTLEFLRPDQAQTLPQIAVTTLIPDVPDIAAVPAATVPAPDATVEPPAEALPTTPEIAQATPAEILPPADPAGILPSMPAEQPAGASLPGEAGTLRYKPRPRPRHPIRAC